MARTHAAISSSTSAATSIPTRIPAAVECSDTVVLMAQLRAEKEKTASMRAKLQSMERQLEQQTQENDAMKKAVDAMRADSEKKLAELQQAMYDRTQRHRIDLQRQEETIDKQNAALMALQQQFSSPDRVPPAPQSAAAATLDASDIAELQRLLSEQTDELEALDKRISAFEQTTPDSSASRQQSDSISALRKEVISQFEALCRTNPGLPVAATDPYAEAAICERWEIARSITDDFIRQGAPQELNISSPTRDAILDMLQRGEKTAPPSLSMFDSARREVAALLRSNSAVSKFASSPHCEALPKRRQEAGSGVPAFETLDSILADADACKAFHEFLRDVLHAEECSAFLIRLDEFKKVPTTITATAAVASIPLSPPPAAAVAVLQDAVTRLTSMLEQPHSSIVPIVAASTPTTAESSSSESERGLELVRTESRICLVHTLAMLKAGVLKIAGIDELVHAVEAQLNITSASGLSQATAETLAAIKRVRAIVDLLKEGVGVAAGAAGVVDAFPSDGEYTGDDDSLLGGGSGHSDFANLDDSDRSGGGEGAVAPN